MVETVRAPTMVICPVCGYDPEPSEAHLSTEELLKQRLNKIFMLNAQQSWWLSQTEYVCKWLKGTGLNPGHILDVGCGDGRWIYGIKLVFPQACYVGIERLCDHYLLNKERLPEVAWVYGDFRAYKPPIMPDTVFIMGTLNPILLVQEQTDFLIKVREIAPLNLVFLFDRNQTGREPAPWIADAYNLSHTLTIEKDYRSEKQDLVVWRYCLK